MSYDPKDPPPHTHTRDQLSVKVTNAKQFLAVVILSIFYTVRKSLLSNIEGSRYST